MNLETPLQTLKFLWLKWPISQVEYWLNYPTPGLDYFLFDFHFAATTDPDKPLGLCVFAHNGTPNASPGWFNPYNPDVLVPYESNSLSISGPVKLTSNMLTVQQIQDLLGGDSQKDYLLFTPNLNTESQIYYTVSVVPGSTGVKSPVTTTAKTGPGSGGSTTNPSPPA